MSQPSEKDLDRALEDALRTKSDFAEWFLGRTSFAGRTASYVWSRSDHPWSKYELEIPNPHGGEPQLISREGETDILAVFMASDGSRFGLHIENKREQGQFTQYQPEGYAARAKKWVGNATYGSYHEWATVLIAPKAFAARFPNETKVFGTFIAYEDIAAFVPAFAET